MKNNHIHIKTTEKTKEALLQKAEDYGSLTAFLEMIARHDIIILDSNASKLLKTWLDKEKEGIKIEKR
jgi:hypothetical protein